MESQTLFSFFAQPIRPSLSLSRISPFSIHSPEIYLFDSMIISANCTLLTDNMKYFWRIASWIINGFIVERCINVYYVTNFPPLPPHYVNYIALSLVKLGLSPIPSNFSRLFLVQAIGKRLSTVRWLIRIRFLRDDNTFKIVSTRVRAPFNGDTTFWNKVSWKGIEQSSFSSLRVVQAREAREISDGFRGINSHGLTKRIVHSRNGRRYLFEVRANSSSCNRRNSVSVYKQIRY